MANEELPQRHDDDPPAHPQTEATDSSRPAQRGRHDIVEEADDGFFWPTVDDLLTIDFSTDLTDLDEATGWDPSVIPDLAAASARGAESEASVEGNGAVAAGNPAAEGDAIPLGEALPLFGAKALPAVEDTPGGPGLFDDPVRVPADGIGTGAAVAAGLSAPFVGRVSGPASFGDDIVDPPEQPASKALEPAGLDPLFAPVPTEKGVDVDVFSAATSPVAAKGADGTSPGGGAGFGLLADAPSVVVPERTPFTPASNGLSTVDLVRDMADRRWFTTAAVGAIALAVGVIGWTNVVSGRSEAEIVADQPVDSTTTTTEAPATTTPSITATILPPTTEILTTSTATNTTLPPTRPRPTTVPAPTAPAPPPSESPAPTPAPTEPAPTDPPSTPAPTPAPTPPPAPPLEPDPSEPPTPPPAPALEPDPSEPPTPPPAPAPEPDPSEPPTPPPAPAPEPDPSEPPASAATSSSDSPAP